MPSIPKRRVRFWILFSSLFRCPRRARAVQDTLAARGLHSSLFDLDGVGVIGAVAPFGDLKNNWENRRVEFNVEN